jgi:lipoprotein-anchoring transpeptidase ErfK/SrfK
MTSQDPIEPVEPVEPVEPIVRRAGRARVDEHRRRRRQLTAVVVVAVVALGGLAAVLQLTGGEPDDTTDRIATAAPETPTTTTAAPTTTVAPAPTTPPDQVLPPSGTGRRVVFSVGRQRMWWVDEADAVLRTSLVSGRPNTPQTGTFQVYSKTLNATGLDGSKMDYFVRFTKGPAGWAIGFHDIPEMDGVPVQTVEQLGQPLSHGCIRQREEDATFTWDFLQVGDTVVVVA